MLDMLEFLLLDSWVGAALVNLVIVVVILACTKYMVSLISYVRLTAEISVKDNAAVGISFAGTLFGIALVLSGAISGQSHSSLIVEAAWVLAYGLLGIVLMGLSRIIFDKISMPHFCLKQQILAGNRACALIDFGHSIASAIIIRAVMLWIEEDNLYGLCYLVVGYILSQLLLNLISVWRTFLYNRCNGESLQTSIESGNLAVALRFSGLRIAIAVAITAGSSFIFYDDTWLLSLGCWLGLSIAAICGVAAISSLLDKVILHGINLRDEVDKQANLAVAAVQAVIAISVSAILLALVS